MRHAADDALDERHRSRRDASPRSPRPISANAMSGSDAISPHTLTSWPAAGRGVADHADQPQHRGMQRREPRREIGVAAVDGQRVLHEIVGADAEERHVLAEAVGDERRAGVSIMTPSGTSARNGTPRAASSSPPRPAACAPGALRPPLTISGSMMRTSPCTPARMSARSCTLNISGSSRHMRIARHPRNGLASADTRSRQLVAADDRTSGSPPAARRTRSTHSRIGAILLLFVGHRRAADHQELRAHEAHSFRAALRRLSPPPPAGPRSRRR